MPLEFLDLVLKLLISARFSDRSLCACVLWMSVGDVFIGLIWFGSWVSWLTLVSGHFLICQETIFFAFDSCRSGCKNWPCLFGGIC
jgi:hypothetical protein